ncbi:MAG: FAD-dependent oxidoreductase [Gammaproteobacteria bacterium]
MQTHAHTVIIGGGIMGCSLAYHLCREGMRDVLLLEKGELTSGSTWHAAGQITHSVSHYALAQMVAYGAALYPRLEAQTGQSCGWHACGSLRVAYDRDEVDWLHHTAAVGGGLGHAMEVIMPKRIAELHPFYNLDGIRAALHTPDDGHADPAGLARALAEGARAMGASIVRRNRARGIRVKRSGEFLIDTELGGVTAHTVVNAGGAYARQIGAWLGLDLPIANLLHHYLITEAVPEFAELQTELPVVRDDRLVSGYIRMEQRAGLIGIYEKTNPATVWDDGAPWESENELFDADYDSIMPWLQNAMQRMPALSKVGIRRVVRGAITHPADGNMLLGPSAVKNFWLCCGAQVGIAWGAGAGKYLAQWIAHGGADISLRAFDPLRFGARMNARYRIDKAKEDYTLRHEIPYPARDRPACRPSHSKTSPLYQTLAREGAVYEEVFGWERPSWFAPDGARAHIHAFRRSALHRIIGGEVAAARSGAAVADLSAFAKVEISGGGAAAFLARVSCNQPPQPGRIRLTYFINDNGRIEGEATLAGLGDGRYYLVYAAAREAALLRWLAHQTKPREAVRFDNVSEKYGVLLVAGPESRAALSACSGAALDNAHFPWQSWRAVSLAGADARALRISYSGELAWELHLPMESMLGAYRELRAAAPGIAHIGSAALGAMRMEKGYLSGHELSGEVTLAEAGLLRFARGRDFQGRAAAVAAGRRQLVCLAFDEPAENRAHADPLGGESVWHRGRAVGRISSGGYAYAIGRYLAFAYVAPDCARAGVKLNAPLAGAARPAVVVEPPLYDADNRLQLA